MLSLRAMLQRPRSRSRRTVVRVALFIIIISCRGKFEGVLIFSFVLSRPSGVEEVRGGGVRRGGGPSWRRCGGGGAAGDAGVEEVRQGTPAWRRCGEEAGRPGSRGARQTSVSGGDGGEERQGWDGRGRGAAGRGGGGAGWRRGEGGVGRPERSAAAACEGGSVDRKSTRLNSSHSGESRMPSSA